jgi:redox-sensitive bicupin YhaK (pirin superfamily)
VLYQDGDMIHVSADQAQGVRFLLVSGQPIKEPVAWYGPIVMNTHQEIQLAFDEYRNGTFIKSKGKGDYY